MKQAHKFSSLDDLSTISFSNGSFSYLLNETDLTASISASDDFTIEENIIIPDSVEYSGQTYTVTSIAPYAFYGKKMTSINLGSKIQILGDWCFAFCTLVNINFPPSLLRIGEYAFVVSTLNSVTFPDSILEIGQYAFAFSDLKSANLPPSLEYLPAYLFAECETLTGEFIIPHNVQVIQENAFRRTKITGVFFPTLITQIHECAFYECTKLSCEISFPDYLQIIGKEAFSRCPITKLSFVGLEFSIGKKAFYFCTELSGAISIGAFEIGEGAFYGCSKITLLSFSDGTILSEIPSNVFKMCSLLKDVSPLPSSLKKIGDSAFEDCQSLIGSMEIPRNVESIGSRAFSGCTSLNGILSFQGNSLISIGRGAFMNVNHIFSELSFPQSLTVIEPLAFLECQFSGSLIIPDNVESIGDKAFFGCSGFTGILIIGNGVKTINTSAFAGCTGFSGHINFGENIERIEERTFFGCNSFTGALRLPPNLVFIGDFAFYGCSSFSGELQLPNKLTSIGVGAFADCSNLSGVLIIPESIEIIDEFAFFQCRGFIEVEFMNELVVVNHQAFGHMHNKCFRNVPDAWDDSLYESDNFNGNIIPKSKLNMNCTAFYFVDIFLTFLITIGSSGVAGIAGLFFFNIISNNRRIKARIRFAFTNIIKNELKNEKEENESVEIVVQNINSRIIAESLEENFNMTQETVEKIINECLITEWPSILPSNSRKVVQNSLKDVILKPKTNYLMIIWGFLVCRFCKSVALDQDQDSSRSDELKKSIL